MSPSAASRKSQLPSQDGKRRLNIPVEPEFHRRVKIAAILAEETIEKWVTTAIEMRLGIK